MTQMQRYACGPNGKVARTMAKIMRQVKKGIILFRETPYQPDPEETKSIERKCAIGYFLVTPACEVMFQLQTAPCSMCFAEMLQRSHKIHKIGIVTEKASRKERQQLENIQ